MMGSKLIILAGIVGLVIAAAGCGGDSATSAPLTKAEFMKAGNAACIKASNQIQAKFRAYTNAHEGDPETKANTERHIDDVAHQIIIPAMQQEAEEFAALNPPEGDEKEVEALVAAMEEGIEKAEKRPERAVQDGTEAFGKSNRLAREYGLSDC